MSLQNTQLNDSWTLYQRLREQTPLVQCITNYVAMNMTANVLLAAGASPAMVHCAEESGEFAALASALSINMGTPSPQWAEGMYAAIAGAQAAGVPWVLDPVAHAATGFRRQLVTALLARRPTAIRGNASEIIALAGASGQGRGMDSGDSVESAGEAARQLARAQGCVVLVTGEVDLATDGQRSLRIEGGSALMPQVTAMGCALSALLAGFIGVAPGHTLAAAVAAAQVFAAAGLKAEQHAQGPGSFLPAFLDALHLLQPSDLQRCPVSEQL
ncbi:hydroxyethylthiazole kinase [Pseudomonas sp.]|uniref:hydroxyethylthiazole kinase n=1 Tax=Pseudomonas sp. TaxID=306 RepID=UPI003CC62263